MPRDRFILWFQERSWLFKITRQATLWLYLILHKALVVVGPYAPSDGESLLEHRKRIDWLLHYLKPQDRDIDLVWIGPSGDGGYPVPIEINPGTVVSVGIGDNYEWDKDLARAGFTVFQFDHTLKRAPEQHPGLVFAPLGVAECRGSQTRPLQELVEIAGKHKERKAILKMDVEGAEWPALASCSPGFLEDFDCVIVELHFLHKRTHDRLWGETQAAIERLRASHDVAWVRSNNAWALLDVAGVPLPPILEVVLVRRTVGALGNPPPPQFDYSSGSSWPGRPVHRLDVF